MIIRKTYPELIENHIKPLCEMLRCYSDKPIAKYNDQKKTITFPNGSTILFRYCDNDSDAERFQGTEVDVLFVDEATHQSEERFKKLTACVRGTNNFPKRIMITCNPGGEGHGWVKRLFIDRHYKDGEDPDDYEFIQSLPTDNTALLKHNPDYIKQLEALPPKLRSAWLYGDWNIYEGQFFEDFRDDPKHYLDHKWTHVIEPFDVQLTNMKIYRSYDFGYNKPFSCAWWAVSEDGVIYRILELYGCTETPNEGVKWEPHKQFEEIARIEREHPYLRGQKIFGVADPACWDKSRGESVMEVAEQHGVYFEPGNNNRIQGWMQCHYRFAFDENGRAMMYVFKNCKAFIRTIPLLIYSKTKPEDLDTSMEDHVADEFRYFCMSRPISPRTTKKAEFKLEFDPLGTLHPELQHKQNIFDK